MRILFAIGNRAAEEYIEKILKEKNDKRIDNDENPVKYDFVGYAVHKDTIIEMIKTKGPDIVILR